MTIAAMPVADVAVQPTEITVEADVDLGVTSRLLDLLVTHDRFPQRMNLMRDGQTMTVTMSLPASDAPDGRLLAKMRQMPGVRRADALAAMP